MTLGPRPPKPPIDPLPTAMKFFIYLIPVVSAVLAVVLSVQLIIQSENTGNLRDLVILDAILWLATVILVGLIILPFIGPRPPQPGTDPVPPPREE